MTMLPFASVVGYNVASLAARMLDAALDKNHIPISNEAKRAGESLLTIERPIGESVSSPIVCMQ